MTEAQGHYPFSVSDYSACADSSGQICQMYKRLHRLSSVPFTLRDLHAVFVAGFTLIYSICAKPSLYDAQRADDIGACSTVLYVITEQWPSARRYRDAFETVVEKMVERTRKSDKEDSGTCPPQAVVDGTDQGAPQPLQSHAAQTTPRTESHGLHGIEHAATQSRTSPNYGEDSSFQNGPVSTKPPDSTKNRANFSNIPPTPASFDTGFGVDLDFNFDEIGGLLTNEGMDWFTEAIWG